MGDASKKRCQNFSIFTGIKEGNELIHRTLLGRATLMQEGDYKVTIGRPHKKFFSMKKLSDGSAYQVSMVAEVCGVGKVDSTLKTFLELDILGYPPLFMALTPSNEEVA